jgi:ketosteroid isomerase-like protein
MLRLLLLPAFLLLATSALAEEPGADAEPAESAPSINDVVEAGNYLFQRAFEDADARALADLYTEDGRVIPPAAAPIAGRPAIASFWAEQMKTTQRVRLETSQVEDEGNLAVEEGVAYLISYDGSETAIQYIVVWKRVGRRWHLHRDIWNAAPASEPEGAREAAPAESPDAPEEAMDAPEGGAQEPAAEVAP